MKLSKSKFYVEKQVLLMELLRPLVHETDEEWHCKQVLLVSLCRYSSANKNYPFDAGGLGQKATKDIKSMFKSSPT
jgi:hypothetical protein